MTSPIINADAAQRVVIDTESEPWTQSPAPGVWRRCLERHGGESGRATSIVRFEPGARFPEHAHPEGEEVLVLDGAFGDETGSYSAGMFLLSPPGSRHAPACPEGCLLFVKLCQYAGPGRRQIVLDTRRMEWQPAGVPGVWSKALYSEHGHPERIELLKLDPGAALPPHAHPAGEEVLVLEGELEDEDGVYARRAWIRNPAGSIHAPRSRKGCVIYLKTGLVPPQ